MNIKLKTDEQLSTTVANGLAGVFVNGVSLSTSISSASSKVYFDNRISGIAGSNDLSVVKLSADEYAQMLDDSTCLSNAVYIVEAPNIDAFKQQIKNIAPGTDLSDAVNVEQLNIVSTLANYYMKSETSSAAEISSALSTISSELSGLEDILHEINTGSQS